MKSKRTKPLYSVTVFIKEAFLCGQCLSPFPENQKVKKGREKGNAFQQILLNKRNSSKRDSLGAFCVPPILPTVSIRAGHLNTVI